VRTVWSDGSLPLVPARFRPIYTVFLPLVDLHLLAFAAIAVLVGSQVVEDFTLAWFPYAWAATMGLGAVLASIGLVFMRDWTELVGKGVLVIGFIVYGVVLGFYVNSGSLSSLLTITLVDLAVIGLLIRIGDLVGEIGRKEADESASRRVASRGKV
jgi:hypothetical protein